MHQVLSYSRRGNAKSILQSLLAFEPYQLVPYVIAQRYASVFLEADEAASIIAKRKRAYYRDLAKAAFRLKGRAFWQYHKLGLRALSERETHDWPYFHASSDRSITLVSVKSWNSFGARCALL